MAKWSICGYALPHAKVQPPQGKDNYATKNATSELFTIYISIHSPIITTTNSFEKASRGSEWIGKFPIEGILS
jgi:hypothetical protein